MVRPATPDADLARVGDVLLLRPHRGCDHGRARDAPLVATGDAQLLRLRRMMGGYAAQT